MLRTTRAIVLAAVMVAMSAAPVSSANELTAEARRASVGKLADALRQRYVYPDVGARLADTITANMQAGAYDEFVEPGQLAARLKADLDAVAHDKHLNLEAANSPPVARALPLPLPPRSEAGVVRADKLQGDVGYVEVAAFPPLPRFKPAINRAMNALAGSKALIVDVRRNSGGSPASVAYLVSFLIPQGTHINDVVVRTPNTSNFTRRAFSAEPTPVNFIGLPIFILTSSNTFSGGEEFAYDLQSLKVGTVVGEATGGGANPTERVVLDEILTAFIPNGRAENPVTKTNWEGVGVKPDVSAVAAEALKVALAQLGQSAAGDIGRASQAQVFTPRSTPMVGSSTALRHVLTSVAAGSPHYARMSADASALTKRDLPVLQRTLTELGALKSMRFKEVDAFGGDVYEVEFANGTRLCPIAMAPDGKIDAWGIRGVARP